MSRMETKIKQGYEDTKNRIRVSLIWQVALLFVIGILISGTATFAAVRIYTTTQVMKTTARQGGTAADDTVYALNQYPAHDWLISCWHTHADTLDIEYDVGYQAGTRTEEKARRFMERHPDLAPEYITAEEAAALPEEDQKIYAEIVYTWYINRINQIKKANNADYLFCVMTDDAWQDQFFLFSAGDEETPRGTEYESTYILGTQVSVADNKEQCRAMENAFNGESSTAMAGNYMDYYQYYCEADGLHVLIGLTYSLEGLRGTIGEFAQNGTVFNMALQVFLACLCLVMILFWVLKPLKKVQENIRLYRETKDSASVIPNLESIRSRNEIGQLSRDIIDLAHEFDDYIEQIEKITTERERITAELNLAAKIQASWLPTAWPAFPDHDEFDIFALNDPAREVGGDFYDYFLIDDTHLAFLIADVSGKSISGALFMMVTMTQIRNAVLSNPHPAAALEAANRQICANNPEEMFVSVWLGILDITTGELTAANAGHEYPVLKQPGRPYELYRDRHGFVLGGFAEVRYKEYTIHMKPGAKIVVYTDGVPEATASDGSMFGFDRMLDSLNQEPDESVERTLCNVMIDLVSFVGDGEQFDDITMLCFEYCGAGEKKEEN